MQYWPRRNFHLEDEESIVVQVDATLLEALNDFLTGNLIKNR